MENIVAEYITCVPPGQNIVSMVLHKGELWVATDDGNIYRLTDSNALEERRVDNGIQSG